MYTVRPGDNLSAIAQRHGVALGKLLAANPQVKSPSLIFAGQAIHIPGDGFDGPRPAPQRTGLQRGATGNPVLSMQRKLVAKGFLTAGQLATGPGIFGPRTEAAVRAFQASRGLPTTGVAGPQTLGALDGDGYAPPARPAPAPSPEQNDRHLPQYDGRRPAPGVANTRAWEPVTAPVRSNASNRSRGLYDDVVNQFAVGVNLRYARRDGNTYCNIFVWDVTKAMGAEIPHWVNGRELDANSCNSWLRSQGAAHGWKQLSASEAQAAANRGQPAVASWNNPVGIGHIAMVRPGTINDSGPASAQAGGHNFNFGHIANGFGSRQPTYWVHA
ncbi:MAG: Muramidase (flagellum-specific) [Myxococcaceae bacterium]|nr:Muramidase (flagellum-specific) [Myxococcaceae bacterium]